MKKLIFSIFILLSLLVSTASAEFFRDIIVTSPDGIWTDARAYATLNDAIAAIGTNDREIVIASPQVVTTLTVPATARLRFERNGSITNSGQLTINTTNISAGNRQIFTGAGNIDFADGSNLKTGWFSNIESAFALTSNDSVTLIISKPHTITASYSPGDNVNLKWESPGNILSINTGVIVGNLKNIEAGNFQLFDGAGDFDFLDGTSLKLYWFNDLRSLITWVETEKVTVIVSSNNDIEFTNTIESNVYIDFVSEQGSFTLNSGVVLTIEGTLDLGDGVITIGAGGTVNIDGYINIDNGYISSGVGSALIVNSPSNIKAPSNHQIFTGTGTFTFTVGGVVYAEWWGAVADGVTDSSEAIQSALISMGVVGGSGAKLQLLAGTYIADTTTVYAYWTIQGVSRRGTVLQLKDGTDGDLLDLTDDYSIFITLRDLSIDGNYTNQTGGPFFGINLNRTGTNITSSGWHHLENLEVREVLGSGLYILGNSNASNFIDISTHDNTQMGFNLSGGSDNYFSGCTSYNNMWFGYYITGPNNHFVACKSFLNGLNTDGDTTFFGSTFQPGWVFRDTGGAVASANTLSSCTAQENYAHGFYFHEAENVTLSACIADTNSQGTDNTYDGYFLKSSTNININGVADNYLPLVTNRQRYGINIDNTSDLLNINLISNNQDTGNIYKSQGFGKVMHIILNGKVLVTDDTYYWVEDFDDEIPSVQFESGLQADHWVTAGTNYAAANVIYYAALPNGVLESKCAVNNDNSVTMLGPLIYNTNNKLKMEIKVQINSNTDAAFYVGFGTASFVDKATPGDNNFLVGMDTDNGHGYGATRAIALSNDNAAGAITDDLITTIANNVYKKIYIDLSDIEQPIVEIGGFPIPPANITGTVKANTIMAPYIMVQNLTGAVAQRIRVDYIKIWSDR